MDQPGLDISEKAAVVSVHPADNILTFHPRNKNIEITIVIEITPGGGTRAKVRQAAIDFRKSPVLVVLIELRYPTVAKTAQQNVEVSVVIVVAQSYGAVVDTCQTGVDVGEGSIIVPVDDGTLNIVALHSHDYQIKIAVVVHIPPSS